MAAHSRLLPLRGLDEQEHKRAHVHHRSSHTAACKSRSRCVRVPEDYFHLWKENELRIPPSTAGPPGPGSIA